MHTHTHTHTHTPALHVFDTVDLLLLRHALLVGDGREVLLAQAIDRFGVVSQIELRADEQQRRVRAVMRHFGIPLGAHVLKRRRRNDAEANQKHVRLRIRQRAQAIVVLLTGCSLREYLLFEATTKQNETKRNKNETKRNKPVSQRPRLIGLPSTITLAE